MFCDPNLGSFKVGPDLNVCLKIYMTLSKVYSLRFLVGLEYVPLDMTITDVLLESYQCINMH